MAADLSPLYDALREYDVTDKLDRAWKTYHVPPNDMEHVMALIVAYFSQYPWGSEVHINGNSNAGVDMRYHPGLVVFEIIFYGA